MSDELNIDEKIKQLDFEIAQNENLIQRAKDLEELKEDERFQRVFFEGFLEEEAQRIFELLTHPLTVKPEDVHNYESQLATIKNMGRYFGTPTYKGTLYIQANNAKKIVDELESMKQELLTSKGDE